MFTELKRGIHMNENIIKLMDIILDCEDRARALEIIAEIISSMPPESDRAPSADLQPKRD